ncbi:hypothetical protein ACJJIW_08925 [Microbulbifer sp. JMSA004]|uniref:hypothetical protein n=1 Tax=Microbulbifer sp. JMSA004 TaxID=3243370 RepID=UPI00403A491A
MMLRSLWAEPIAELRKGFIETGTDDLGYSLLNNTIKDRRYPETTLATIWLANVDAPDGKRLVMTLSNGLDEVIANCLKVLHKIINSNPVNACGTFVASHVFPCSIKIFFAEDGFKQIFI